MVLDAVSTLLPILTFIFLIFLFAMKLLDKDIGSIMNGCIFAFNGKLNDFINFS